jgi:hypothetical protein
VTDIEKQAQASLDAETAKAKTWFAANREEAIVLVCISLAVGLLLGMLVGYIMRGHA